jgi:hypothetical protein
MSEKYYVVSNSELHALCVAAEIAFKSLQPDGNYRFEDCFEACRARPADKVMAVLKIARKIVSSDNFAKDDGYMAQLFEELAVAVEALEGDV